MVIQLTTVLAQDDSGENTDDNPTSFSEHQTSSSSPNSTPIFFNSWWVDLILISAITIVISIIIFLILKYFLNRFARTLNLDKGERKGHSFNLQNDNHCCQRYNYYYISIFKCQWVCC